jgi:hypothetical protein
MDRGDLNGTHEGSGAGNEKFAKSLRDSFKGDNRPKVVKKTKELLSKQATELAKRADEHEEFINKITYCVGVVSFGTFCYLLGSRPADIPKLYCLFFIIVAPLRWMYYRIKKWHYFLLDFCYYANVIFVVMLLYFPTNDKLFLICFSFSEGPLAWALIVWRCSLVFSSVDKIVSVLIHLLPGTVFFIIRWWDPITFSTHAVDDTGPWPAWPLLESDRQLWKWLFLVPLVAYCVWQFLYLLVVNVLRRQRLLNDPEVLTSFRELSRKASRANNIWWKLSGLLGADNRVAMYAILQGIFTILTMALTVPLFKHYRLHIAFECLKVAASVWNGGIFFFDVMPKKMDAKKKRKFSPTKGPVSLDTTGLPFEGASVLDPPLSPGGLSSPNEEAALCSLCRKSSSAADLSDADAYADQVDEQVHARKGRTMDTEGIALAT